MRHLARFFRMIHLDRYAKRFALGGGIYIGKGQGVHIYLDFWGWSLSFESRPRVKAVARELPPLLEF